MKKKIKHVDYVSACCLSGYKRKPFAGGSHPICKKCKKGCSLQLPIKEVVEESTHIEHEQE